MRTAYSFLLILFITSITYSQDSIKHYYLGEIVVSAENETIMKTSSEFEITKSKISDEHNFDISKSLENSPGISIFRNGRNEAMIRLRGFDHKQTAIFYDGVPIYIPYEGTFDLSQINSMPIQKISVAKSMTSILYGANTLAGSINIITEEPVKDFSAKAMFLAGLNYGAQVSLSGMFKKFYYVLSGNFNKSDGFSISNSFSNTKNQTGIFRNNSQNLQRGVFGKIGYNLNENNEFVISFNQNWNNKGVPVNIYTSYPRYWKYTDWNNYLLNFIHKISLKNFTLRTNLYTNNAYNVLNSYDNETYATQYKNYAFQSTYNEYSTGGSINPELNLKNYGLLKASVALKKDTHYEIPNFNKPEEKFTAETYFAGIEYGKNNFHNFNITGGFSYNYLNISYADIYPIRDNIGALNWQLGTGYELAPAFTLFANVSGKSRFPTLKELFSEHLGRFIANPNLDKERSINTEAGLKYNFQNTNFIISLYYSNVKDLIQIVNISSTKQQCQNIANTEFKGIDLSLVQNFRYFDVCVNYLYLSAKNLTQGATSENLEYRPEHRTDINVSKQYDFGFFWKAQVSYTSNQYAQFTDNYQWVEIPDFIIYDAQIAYTPKSFLPTPVKFFIKINNIFDKYYESEYGFPQPGRNIQIGIDSEF